MTGARKTQIMSRSGINYKQAETYLNLLVRKKLLRVTKLKNTRAYFHTTTRGLRYLHEFNGLKKVLLGKIKVVKKAHATKEIGGHLRCKLCERELSMLKNPSLENCLMKGDVCCRCCEQYFPDITARCLNTRTDEMEKVVHLTRRG